jgi:hypothetical protein
VYCAVVLVSNVIFPIRFSTAAVGMNSVGELNATHFYIDKIKHLAALGVEEKMYESMKQASSADE